MHKTLKEIRKRVKTFGELTIHKKYLTFYVGDDQATFERTPAGIQEALDRAKQLQEEYIDAK